jgi:hypothetical protein
VCLDPPVNGQSVFWVSKLPCIGRVSYVTVHSLVLCLEGEDVFRALRPRLAIVWVDVRHDMSDAIFVVANCFGAAVEIAGAVILAVEILLAFQSVVAVERDDDLDAVTFGIVHEVIQSVEDLIIPGLGSVPFEVGIAVYRRAFLR